MSTPPSLATIMRLGFFGSIQRSWWSPWCDALDVLEGLAAVDALQQRHLREPDDVGVRRIDGERRVVPGALAQVAAGR